MQARVPETEWLIHYTSKDFSHFTQGRRLADNIRDNQFAGGHSSYLVQLDCEKPLSELPFAFQFAWSTSHMIYDTYYPSTIWRGKMRLFRSPSAVQHLGDNGEVVFRSCSEQDFTSLTFKGTIRGEDHSGLWVSDSTGESFDNLLELIQWADKHAGIQRVWPLPIPGFFQSISEIKLWVKRMLLCSWSAYLTRSIKNDLHHLENLQEDTIAYFNRKYQRHPATQGGF